MIRSVVASPWLVWALPRFADGDGIGASDCEDISTGLIAQPVNTYTSLAYVAVAVWIVWWAARVLPRHHRSAAGLYAVNVALIGLGSVAFHGPMPSWARVAHDVPIATTVLFMLLFDVALLTGRHRPLDLRLFGGGVLAITALFVAAPDSSIAATGLLVIVAVVLEFLRFRNSGERWDRLSRSSQIYIAFLVAIGGGVIFNALGKTASPLCEPDSLLQGHGLWHTLSAVAFGLWAVSVFGSTRDDA